MNTLSRDHAEFAPDFRSRQCFLGRDDAHMRSAFELRFHVYCLERDYLPSANYPDRRETDQDDASSAHFCTFNRQDELVGYVRLVRPDASQAFPFQSRCTTLFERAALPTPSEAAEISRLILRQDYRRRRGDTLAGVSEADEVEVAPSIPAHGMRIHSAQILLSLYRQMYLFSLDNGIHYLHAAMERNLARALTRMNFGFRQIGPESDYYGQVAPYLADLRKMEARIGKSNPALMAWMKRPEAVNG